MPIRSCTEVPCARGCTLLWGDEIRGPVRGFDRGGGLGTEAAGGEAGVTDVTTEAHLRRQGEVTVVML